MQTPKSPGAGIVLSFFFPGVGQMYAGRIVRGLVIFFLNPIIFFTAIFAGASGVVLSTLAGIGVAIDADAPAEAIATTGGVGALGLLLGPAWLAWWIWGMFDAKKQCEHANEAIEMPGEIECGSGLILDS